MTWEELTKLEPRLLDLEKKVRENRPNDRIKWSNDYKTTITSLVGFYRKEEGHQELMFFAIIFSLFLQTNLAATR